MNNEAIYATGPGLGTPRQSAQRAVNEPGNPELDALVTAAAPLILSGALQEPPWAAFLRYLREALAVDVAGITLRPGNREVAPVVVWDRASPLSPSQIRRAELDHARLIEQDPLANALRAPGDCLSLDEVIPRAALIKTAFYRELMAPFGIEQQLGLYFAEPGGWGCTIGLMHGAGRRLGEPEKRVLQALRPQLEQALSVYARLRRSEAGCQIFAQTLNRLGLGVILLDAHNRVVDSNAAAQHVLKEATSLSLVNHTLVARHDQGQLGKAIAAAQSASGKHPPEAFASAVRLRPPDGPELGVLVRAAEGPCLAGQSSSRVILYLSNPLQPNPIPEATIVRLFGLTPTEATVAMLLCNGVTLAEMAKILDVTENTARAYSKRIYAKTGVSRQAELVRVILKSVAVVA